MRFDAIVVGGGPAGSLTAYRLATAGVRVALLDSRQFPRDKPCGGGIQHRALQHIPFSCESTFRSRMSSFDFWYRLAPKFSRHSSQALVAGVLRSEFDKFLVDKAIEAGAVAFEKCKATSIASSRGGVKVLTARGEIEADFVVGADGANSIVSRHLNSRASYFWQVALYTEFAATSSQLENATAAIDWGTVPSGYGWIFPKRDHVNIGVGGPLVLGRSLGPYLQRFRSKQLGLGGASSKVRGHQLPTLTARTKLESDRLFLVGDAAGLVEPLTGEGISNACHSARLASEAILGRLGGTALVGSYELAVRAEIGADLVISRRLLSLAVAFPRTLMNWFERDDAVWNDFCGVLSGRSTFATLAQRVVGNFGVLRWPLSGLASTQEAMKLLAWSFLQRGGRATMPPAAARMS